MKFKSIKLNESYNIKGIAILIIAIHNYLRYMPVIALNNNEFEYHNDLWKTYAHFILDKPFWLIESFFSYFVYPMSLFIFLSAYGLTTKFSAKKPRFLIYIYNNYVKLYILLIFGLIIYYFLFNNILIDYSMKKIFIGYINPINQLTSNTPFAPLLGPWWYFALTFQLYLIFWGIYTLIVKYNNYAYFAISIIYLSISYISIYNDWSIYQTILGHLPELLLGIYLAKTKIAKIPKIVLIIALLISIASPFFKILFPLSFISITIIMLAILQMYAKHLNPFFFIGKISMIIFIINGMTRYFAYKYLTLNIPIVSITLYSLLLIVVCSMIFFLFKQITRPLNKIIINDENNPNNNQC